MSSDSITPTLESVTLDSPVAGTATSSNTPEDTSQAAVPNPSPASAPSAASPALSQLSFISVGAALAWQPPRVPLVIPNDDHLTAAATAQDHQNWVRKFIGALTATWLAPPASMDVPGKKQQWNKWQRQFAGKIADRLEDPDLKRSAEQRMWALYDQVLKLRQLGHLAEYPIPQSSSVLRFSFRMDILHQAMERLPKIGYGVISNSVDIAVLVGDPLGVFKAYVDEQVLDINAAVVLGESVTD